MGLSCLVFKMWPRDRQRTDGQQQLLHIWPVKRPAMNLTKKRIPRRRCTCDKPTWEVYRLCASELPASWRQTDALDTSAVACIACHLHHCLFLQLLTAPASSLPVHPDNWLTPTVTAGYDQCHANISYRNEQHFGISFWIELQQQQQQQ